RDFRYAYAKDAAQRLIAPPPKSVPIESLPPEIVDLFEQAFTERGVDARPTATQWVAALDALRAAIRACNKNPLHLYARHLAECVWCTLERKRVLFFGQLPRSRVETSRVAVPTAPSVAMMEEAVAKWPAPRELKAPVLPELRPVSNTAAREQDVDPIVIPLSGLLTGGVIGFAGDAVLGGLLIGSSALIAGALGFRSLRIARRRGAYEEAIARYKRLNAHYADLVGEINEACGVKAHEQWRQATKALRQFVAKDAQALAEFELGTTKRGLRQFLQSQRIDQWKEPRLSYLDRVRLRSAGIETAADFDKAILGKLRMLGAEGRGAVVQWKLDLIREFNRSKPRTAQPDLKTFQAERQRQRRDLEERVADVYSKLKQARKHGSLVLTARMNQLESLKTELYRQHTLCVELGKQLG
ncbi:MAG: hypothetical protein HYV17_14830, partial [Xanthomonadales bacterium]|nr:hypothetical protein [Xanthomonadales bacterium]